MAAAADAVGPGVLAVVVIATTNAVRGAVVAHRNPLRVVAPALALPRKIHVELVARELVALNPDHTAYPLIAAVTFLEASVCNVFGRRPEQAPQGLRASVLAPLRGRVSFPGRRKRRPRRRRRGVASAAAEEPFSATGLLLRRATRGLVEEPRHPGVQSKGHATKKTLWLGSALWYCYSRSGRTPRNAQHGLGESGALKSLCHTIVDDGASHAPLALRARAGRVAREMNHPCTT